MDKVEYKFNDGSSVFITDVQDNCNHMNIMDSKDQLCQYCKIPKWIIVKVWNDFDNWLYPIFKTNL